MKSNITKKSTIEESAQQSAENKASMNSKVKT
jgi:hypothetical protein